MGIPQKETLERSNISFRNWENDGKSESCGSLIILDFEINFCERCWQEDLMFSPQTLDNTHTIIWFMIAFIIINHCIASCIGEIIDIIISF